MGSINPDFRSANPIVPSGPAFLSLSVSQPPGRSGDIRNPIAVQSCSAASEHHVCI